MNCIACAALPAGVLCTKCLEAKAATLAKACQTDGHWHHLSGNPHCDQLLRHFATLDEIVVDSATQSVCHRYRADLEQASRDLITPTTGWPLTKIAYASRHAAKHNLWYSSKHCALRRITPLRLYDKLSILTRMRRAPTTGCPVTDIVCEYDGAHADLYDLVQSKHLLLHNDSVWLNPSPPTGRGTPSSSPAKSANSSGPISTGGTIPSAT